MTSPPSPVAGRVRSLHRYPVKSLGGQDETRLAVEPRGVVGDRAWAVLDPDGRIGSGKTTRRFRRMDGLLHLRASVREGAAPLVHLPDGRSLAVDDPAAAAAVSAQVGRPVSLRPETDVPFLDDGPVHLVTTATLRALAAAHGEPVDARRLRPNLVVDVDGEGFVEDAWAGRRLSFGDDVVLAVRGPMPRCVMVTTSQPGLPAAPGLLHAVTRANDATAGVVLDVVRPGTVALGDPVRLID